LKKRYELLKTEIPLETDVLSHIIFRYEAVTRMRKDAFSLESLLDINSPKNAITSFQDSIVSLSGKGHFKWLVSNFIPTDSKKFEFKNFN